jgi:hypothetical protein
LRHSRGLAPIVTGLAVMVLSSAGCGREMRTSVGADEFPLISQARIAKSATQLGVTDARTSRALLVEAEGLRTPGQFVRHERQLLRSAGWTVDAQPWQGRRHVTHAVSADTGIDAIFASVLHAKPVLIPASWKSRVARLARSRQPALVVSLIPR